MLQNTKILVLEEEFLIAIDLQEMLEANGATDLVFASTVNEAEALLQRGAGFDLAIAEARFGRPEIIALCAALAHRGVAVVVTSADCETGRVFGDLPVIEKPFDERQLVAACRLAMQRRIALPARSGEALW